MLEKYLGKYKFGLSLMEEEQYQQAYDEFSRLIDINPADYPAHAYRGIIGAVFLNKDENDVYQDLKLGIKSPFNIASRTFSLLSSVCLSLDRIDEAIEYAKKAIECDRAIDGNYLLLIRYYVFEKDSIDNLLTALDYIEDLLKENNNDELLSLKANVLNKLERFDEARVIIDKLFFSQSNILNAYILKGDNIFLNQTSQIEDYKLALNYYQDAINLTSNKEIIFSLYLKISDIYKELEQFEKIFDISKKLNDIFPDNPISFLNDAYALHELNKPLEAIKLLEDNLEIINQEMFTSRQYLSLWYYHVASNKEQLYKAIDYALEGLTVIASPIFYSVIIESYDALYDFEQMYNYAIKMIKDFPEEAYGYYIAGYCLFLKKKPFKEYYHMYELAAKKDPSYYKDATLVYYDRNKANTLKYKKNAQFMYDLIDSEVRLKEHWGLRLSSIGHLYGTYNFDVNYELAKDNALQCLEINLSPCNFSLYGACLLALNTRLDEAFEIFNQSHQTFLEYKTTCSCGSSFLARMYLEGIYVSKDKEKAKKIVLECYDKANKFLHSNTSLLYAYFALTNEKEFDIDIALTNLLWVEKEQYYNSPVFYMLSKIYEAKNNSKKAKYYRKKVIKSLKHEPKTIQNEMMELLKQSILFLPPFNNF
jgi:tetratricopeptide (TPR) repeat protein